MKSLILHGLFTEILNDCSDVYEITFQEDGSWCPMRHQEERSYESIQQSHTKMNISSVFINLLQLFSTIPPQANIKLVISSARCALSGSCKDDRGFLIHGEVMLRSTYIWRKVLNMTLTSASKLKPLRGLSNRGNMDVDRQAGHSTH
ncbi:hypothetical protein GH733_016675, partial [Mirounga leonina]